MLAERAIPVYIQLGTVLEVNEETRTIEVKPYNEGAEFVEVPLQAISEGDKGIVLIPKKESTVVIGLIDKNNAICLGFSEIEKVLVAIEETKLEITKNGVIFNGGDHGGIIKIEEVIKKINALEKEVNDLKTVFSLWVPSPQDGGLTLKTSLATWAGKQMVQTIKTDIENEKVKH